MLTKQMQRKEEKGTCKVLFAPITKTKQYKSISVEGKEENKK